MRQKGQVQALRLTVTAITVKHVKPISCLLLPLLAPWPRASLPELMFGGFPEAVCPVSANKVAAGGKVDVRGGDSLLQGHGPEKPAAGWGETGSGWLLGCLIGSQLPGSSLPSFHPTFLRGLEFLKNINLIFFSDLSFA